MRLKIKENKDFYTPDTHGSILEVEELGDCVFLTLQKGGSVMDFTDFYCICLTQEQSKELGKFLLEAKVEMENE